MSNPFGQQRHTVRFGWGAPALDAIGRDAAAVVIVDVLTFTTRVEVAVSAGAAVLPYPLGDENVAADFAAQQGAALIGIGTTPVIEQDGTRIVIPSPNGSALAHAAQRLKARVYAGCLRNAAAVAHVCSAADGPVAVIAAGERWGISAGPLRPALEDALGAGAIIAAMSGDRSPEADYTAAALAAVAGRVPDLVRSSASGLELLARGRAGDVALATERDTSATVPVLSGNAFVAATLAA